MILHELYEKTPLQNIEDDNSSYEFGATRQTRLTLTQLNRLRNMLELRNVEYQDKLDQVKKQYSSGSSGGESMDLGL
jgi:hypothetical protein